MASEQFASDCESEEVCYFQLIVKLLDLRPLLNYYFYNIPSNKPLVLVDYTIQSVWSFFNNQVTVILDRKTRIAIGDEEMLPHVGIR